MDSAFNSLANGLPELLKYMVVATIIYVIGFLTYVKLTPHRELELVQQRNMAAAVSLSALIVSLALPLAACMVNKIGILDMAVWGTVSLFLQLFLFRLTDAIFQGMPTRIEDDEVPAAMVLAAFKLAGSITLALAIVG